MMQLVPAVDISKGKCVRLYKGRIDEAKIYYDNPLDAALRWAAQGAQMLHVIDLDAAVGTGENVETIKGIIKGAGIPCEVGGGIRGIERANEYIESGAERVIFGTAALELKLVASALKSFGAGRVMAAVDHLMGRVAIKGWKELTEIDAMLLCTRLEDEGVRNIMMTSIDRDGTMKGPNLEYALRAARGLRSSVYLAGGFSSINDLLPLRGSGVAGVILGKALYEGTIDLKGALEAVKFC